MTKTTLLTPRADRRPSPLSYSNVVVLIIVFVAIAQTVCWAAGAHFGANKAVISNVFVIISTTAIVSVLVLPWLNLKGQEGLGQAQRMSKMALSWLVVLVVAHLIWEMPWVVFHRYIMGSAGEGQLWSYLWWIYADGGDTRYIHPDGTLLAFETGATLLGLTALALVILQRRAGFTGNLLVAVMALMVCEFYSTILYILTESYAHFRHVAGAGSFVVKFVYGNILWLIVPSIVFLWAARLLLDGREHDAGDGMGSGA
jgi:hypothetical protein